MTTRRSGMTANPRRIRAALLAAFGGLCAAFLPIAGISAPDASPAPPSAVAASPGASTEPNVSLAPSPTPSPGVPLSDIVDESQKAIATLNGIEPDDTSNQSIAEIRQTHADVSKRIADLQSESSKAVADRSSLDALRNLQTGWRKLKDDLDDQSKILTLRAQALGTATDQVQKLETRWKAAGLAAAEAKAPPETIQFAQDVIDAVNGAKNRLKTRQKSVLELQSRVVESIGRVNVAQSLVQQALSDAVKTLLVRDSLPIWDPEVQLSKSVAVRHPETLRAQVDALTAYTSQKSELFLLHAAIFGALLGGILWLRRGLRKWTEEEPGLKQAAPIFEVPFATALALSFVVKGPIYADAPNLFHAIAGAVLLLPTIIVLRRLLDRHNYVLINSLVGFFLVDQLLVATASYPILNRWIFLAEMSGAIAVFSRLIFVQRSATPVGHFVLDKFVPFASRLGLAVVGAAATANALGYCRFGALLGTATLKSTYSAIFLYALVRILQGLTIIALRVKPLTSSHIARLHRELVQQQVYNFLRWAALLTWVFFTLDLLQLRAPLFDHAAFLLEYQIPLGSRSLTLGQLLKFALAIWLSVIVSRVLRFFLDEEIYERVHLSPGLPYAISTMSHYLVLLVGFLIALSLLNVDLTKITIVAGAFSVGLGFGLQNIINNFVSGIILLFERPVKVGDVIQLGDSVGEVRRIGIRASIIRTRDGSDIILPNGNLISNQVTNWTYADRRRAVEIPLNIAAGPDLNHVMELLKTAAAGQCSAPNDPQPQVYVTGMTGGNVSLIVRAWTSRYEDWIEARSELSIGLAGALEKEGIKLT